MLQITLTPSTRQHKKWKAEFSDGSPTVHFGDNRYEDYTMHKDAARLKAYLTRHKKDPASIKTAGGLSRDILWSRPSIREAIKFTE
jgi:hypothetical protein